jgi:hypothetical protein
LRKPINLLVQKQKSQGWKRLLREEAVLQKQEKTVMLLLPGEY